MSDSLKRCVQQIEALPLTAKTKSAIEAALPSVDAYIGKCASIVDRAIKGDRAGSAEMIAPLQASFEDLEARLETLGSLIEEESSQINSDSRSTPSEVFWLSLLTIAFGGGVATWVVLRVSRQLNGMFSRLQSVSHQLNETSQSMLASSETLTNAASSQASAVQEVSSNMEELTATVEVGASGSKHSVELARQVSASVGEGGQSMADLDRSMARIA
jgi:methyl-accepting chemotaxis protein